MTTILRIEHKKNGLGIFQGFGYFNISNRERFISRHENFPPPNEDKLINRYIEKNEFCAFKSIEQLQQWIEPKEIKDFISCGYVVLLIDVSDCIVGEYQIIYEKKNIIQSKNISELFI